MAIKVAPWWFYLYAPQPLQFDDVLGFDSLHFLHTQLSPLLIRFGITGEIFVS